MKFDEITKLVQLLKKLEIKYKRSGNYRHAVLTRSAHIALRQAEIDHLICESISSVSFVIADDHIVVITTKDGKRSKY